MPKCRFLTKEEPKSVKTPNPSPVKNTCLKCFKVIEADGSRHPCVRDESRMERLRQIVSPRTQVMLAKEVVKEKLAEAKQKGEDVISFIGQHGRPLMVPIAGKKRAVITREIMAKYRAQFGISKTKAYAQAQFFKEVTMSKLEHHLKDWIFKADTRISDFFETKTLDMLGYDIELGDDSKPIGSQKKCLHPVKREVLFCNDVPALVLFLMQERLLNEDDVIIKIGLDGGRGFIKVCLSVHDPKEDQELEEEMSNLNSPRKKKLKKKKATRTFKNNGVKKVMIIGLVEDVPEKYENIQKLLELLDLDEIEASYAVDMKLQNTMGGMQSHAATHPCVYCEGSKPWDKPAKARTLGSLREHAEAFQNAPEEEKIPKNFKNAIFDPLFNLPDHYEMLDVMPIAELHLVLGITNTLLFKLNDIIGDDFVSYYLICLHKDSFLIILFPTLQVLKWAKSLNCTPGKHGSKQFDGPDCKELLDNIESLIKILKKKEHKIYGVTLEAFNRIRKASFGMELADNLEDLVEDFTVFFKKIGIPIFPKVHVIMHHLVEFTSRHGPLGPFCEQAFESAHYAFWNTWQNFKRDIGHPQYADHLKRAAIDFNNTRI